MAVFHFRAIDAKGQMQKGVIEADTDKAARQQLRERSLIPLKISSAQNRLSLDAKSISFHSLFSRLRQFVLQKQNALSPKALALITRQFATLLTAGLPIEEALQAVGEQIEKPTTKAILFAIRGKVMEGHTLAAALREHPASFSALFCATIAAGEKTGHLDKVLVQLADYTERQWQIQQKLKTALIYPAMIVLVAVGIVGFLLEYVVPKMIAVYGHLNQALPLSTTILIMISQFMRDDGLMLFAVLLIVGIIMHQVIKKRPQVRKKMHHYLLRFPLVGYAMKTKDTARFSHTFSILSAAGVSVLEAMTIASQLITTIPIQDAVTDAIKRVREGAAIHLALKQTQFFSPMSIHMIASGEASGQLENMLERVAHQQENEIARLIEVALALFEPAIILIMGAIVLFIVLAVLLPIFQLNQFG